MEISPIAQQEWPWLWERSVQTGWAQMTPVIREKATREQAAAQIDQMLRAALATPGTAVLVAREREVPLGYIVVMVMPDELSGEPIGTFLDIYVDPQYRGSGLASHLTRAGEDHCRRLGLRAVRRFVSVHNQASLRHAQRDGAEIERVGLIKRL